MHTSDNLAETARVYLQNIDGAIKRARSALHGRGARITCAKGCAWCCRLPVRATLPEGALAARYIRDTLPPPEVAALVGHMEDWLSRRENAPLTRGIPDVPACPFLADDLCIIYPARPMGCRVHSSTADPALCGRGQDGPALFESPGTVAEVIDEVKPVCMDYRLGLEQSGMNFQSIVKHLPELVLEGLKTCGGQQ